MEGAGLRSEHPADTPATAVVDRAGAEPPAWRILDTQRCRAVRVPGAHLHGIVRTERMRNGMFVADAHTHVFPETTRIYGRTVKFGADDLIKVMDTNGVDAAVVIARPSGQLSISELRALHDRTANEVAKHKDRLVGFCWAAP